MNNTRVPMEILKEQMPCLHIKPRKKIKLVHEYYTAVEAGKILGIKWTHMQRLIKKNQLKVSCSGKNILISRAEILLHLNGKNLTKP